VPAATAENTLTARILDINFAGATSSIKLNANGLSLEALVLQPDGLVIGNECVLTLPAEKILLLRNE
jgi:hypothetical protein